MESDRVNPERHQKVVARLREVGKENDRLRRIAALTGSPALLNFLKDVAESKSKYASRARTLLDES